MADGARMTRQRAAITGLLDASNVFRSATQIHDLLTEAGHVIGLATVYRTLQAMAEDSAVDVLRQASGETLYRRCEATGHHHHLVCRQCGRTVEVAGPSVESWAADVAGANGFTDVEHTVEVTGICPDCRAAPAAKTTA